MPHGKELIEVTALDGTSVKITLADWAETLIERALTKHRRECPVESYKAERQIDINTLDKRVLALELELKITRWLMAPIYLGIVAWLIAHFTNFFDKVSM